MNRKAQKYRTLIIDQQRLFREGLRALLSSNPKIKIVGEAGNGHEAIRLIKKLKPKLILMDLFLPKIEGLDVIVEVKKQSPETKIIAVTALKHDYYILESLKAGVNGYLLRDSTYKQLTLAIKRVLAGDSYVSHQVSEVIKKATIDKRKTLPIKSAWESLTRRERQTSKLVAEGYSNKEIAEILDIGISSVKYHRYNAMDKLDLNSVFELTAFSMETGLIAWEPSSPLYRMISPKVDSHELKTLLVHNDKYIRDWFRDSFEFDQVSIMEAKNPDEALHKVETEKAEFVVMGFDLQHRKDGLRLTKKIKEAHPEVIIVILIEDDLPKYHEMAKECGADYSLPMSSIVEGKELKEIARSVLESKFKL